MLFFSRRMVFIKDEQCACACVYVCELQREREREMLLSLGSASWVCCWPDQLAVCLWGCGTSQQRALGRQATAQRLSTPQFNFICVLPPPIAYSAECKEQMCRYGAIRSANVTFAGLDSKTFSHAHVVQVKLGYSVMQMLKYVEIYFLSFFAAKLTQIYWD